MPREDNNLQLIVYNINHSTINESKKRNSKRIYRLFFTLVIILAIK